MRRGTDKKVNLNETLQRNADKAKVVTAIARNIYKTLTAACGSCRQRDLWQMILKRMYKASSIEAGELVKSLGGLEMNEAYSYSRIVPKQTIEATLDGKTLQIALRQQGAAIFSSSLPADALYYLILTEVKGGREGRATEAMKATGIQIAVTGSLGCI